MNYSDFYLLRLIKKAHERLSLLEARFANYVISNPPPPPPLSYSIVYWENTGPNPSAPPPDTSRVYIVKFRDGYPDKTWDPLILDWR